MSQLSEAWILHRQKGKYLIKIISDRFVGKLNMNDVGVSGQRGAPEGQQGLSETCMEKIRGLTF